MRLNSLISPFQGNLYSRKTHFCRGVMEKRQRIIGSIHLKLFIKPWGINSYSKRTEQSLRKSWCVFLQNLGWRWGRGNPLTVMSRVFHRKFIRENCIYHSGISKPGERSPCQTYIFYFITQAIQTCVYMWYSSTFISVILNCSCVSESLVETIESGQVRLCCSDKWSPNIMAYYSKDLVLAHCMYSWWVTHGSAPSCVHYDTRWKSNL